jgi:hypothetical protein
MMRKASILISALVFVSSAVFSQGQLDAYKYSQTDLGGTARYLGMGGAFGALGGDISVMNANPAGLAVYRSSEIVTTLSHRSIATKVDNISGSRAKLNFDNIAYVGYFPTSNSSGVLSWNAGFSYNRVKDYSRNYSLNGLGNSDPLYSLTDYMAERANAIGANADKLAIRDGYDPYSVNGNDWLSILGYESVLIDATRDGNQFFSAFGNVVDGIINPYPLAGRELRVSESGAVDLYNIAFGLNISDIVLVGANVSITDLNYHYNSYFAEDFANNSNYLELENWLTTEGSGYALNTGVIIRPVSFLRFGLAYNSPTWYKMTDFYQATVNSVNDYWGKPVEDEKTPGGAFYEYQFRTPDKWLFSAAAILGQSALLSVDYELVNYGSMKVFNMDGIEDPSTNGDIKANFASVGTLRIGGEVKVTPQFAVRAGYSRIGNPMSEALKNATQEVYTVGTIPHYTIEKGISNYSVGLGYRFTPNFYLDMACVLKSQKEDLYAFSNIYNGGERIVHFQPGALTTNTTQVSLTLGYKF